MLNEEMDLIKEYKPEMVSFIIFFYSMLGERRCCWSMELDRNRWWQMDDYVVIVLPHLKIDYLLEFQVV